MGPLRRQLTGLALALPTAAKAEVCDKVRPDWSVASGPQGWLAETGYLLASPPALLLLLLLAAALVVPRLWLALPAAILALAFAALLAIRDQSEIAAMAATEGCLATALPAALFLTIAAILTLARTLHLRRR